MKVHHIGYLVKKLARAQKTFEMLGYACEGDVTHDESRGIDILFMVNGTERVELVSPFAENSAVGELGKRVGNAPYHICYCTDDLDADAETLSASGFVMTAEPKAAPAIKGNRVAFFFSPAIGMIELVEDVM